MLNAEAYLQQLSTKTYSYPETLAIEVRIKRDMGVGKNNIHRLTCAQLMGRQPSMITYCHPPTRSYYKGTSSSSLYHSNQI